VAALVGSEEERPLQEKTGDGDVAPQTEEQQLLRNLGFDEL